MGTKFGQGKVDKILKSQKDKKKKSLRGHQKML